MQLTSLSPITEIIHEARNGRMVILVDDEGRGGEGALVLPAQMVTPGAVNFMATHGRGLVCLALSKSRADHLGLEPMNCNNARGPRAAFTQSIEARTGVTTGISAADRARTIAIAIDGMNGSEAIVSPGHVFPLIAQPGGVLERAGHTEAAMDIARLAGLNESAVTCEIMNNDGTMARLEHLVDFADRHGLKMGAISDLIAHCSRFDPTISRLSQSAFKRADDSAWIAIEYGNRISGDRFFVLATNAREDDAPVQLTLHQIDVVADVARAAGAQAPSLAQKMELLAARGPALIIFPGHDMSLDVGNTRAAVTLDERRSLVGQILCEMDIQHVRLEDAPSALMKMLWAHGVRVSLGDQLQVGEQAGQHHPLALLTLENSAFSAAA